MDSKKTGPSARAAAASATTSASKHGHVLTEATDAMSSYSAPALALRKKPKKRLSSGAAAQRDESEFVSVEVGMREFQRRLASSKGKSDSISSGGANAESSRSAAVLSGSSVSRDRLRGKRETAPLPSAAEQPNKRTRTTKAAEAVAITAKQPEVSTAVRRSATGAAPRARKPATSDRGNTDPPVLQDPVKTPRKRAVAPAKAASVSTKAKAPVAPSTAVARKPRAAPVARRQTTIAEIRAQLLREQQERVELRIQTLHCANCNSVTHTHDGHGHTQATSVSPAGAVVGPHRSIHQQQQLQQQPVTSQVPAQQTRSSHYHLPAMPLSSSPSVPAQHTVPTQTPVVHSNPVVSAPRSDPAAIVQPAAAAAPSEPDPIKNEFISDDFNEDMAFMLALDEVERSLTTPTKATPAHLIPPPSVLYQHYATPPSNQQQPTATEQLAAAGEGLNRQQPTGVNQSGSSQFDQDVKASPKEVRVSFDSVSCHSRTNGAHALPCMCCTVQTQAAPAMSADVQREFERLKRENELLRQSNELLQAAAASSSTGSTAAHQPPSPVHQTPQLRPAIATATGNATSSSASPSLAKSKPPPAVQDLQRQPFFTRRLLDLHQGADAIKQEPVATGIAEHSVGAASGSVERRGTHQDRNGGEPIAARPVGQREHHHSPPATGFDDSRALIDSLGEGQRDKASGNDFAVDESNLQAVAEELDHEEGDARVHTPEKDSERANAQRASDSIEEDQSGGVINTQQSSENEGSGVSQSGEIDGSVDDEEEAFEEARQEEISRASTIDRGNYQQYKAREQYEEEEADEDDEEDDEEEDDNGGDVEMDAKMNDEATQSVHIPSPPQPPTSHSSLLRTLHQVDASDHSGAEGAARPSTSPHKVLVESDCEINLGSTESLTADPIAAEYDVGHKADEQVVGEHIIDHAKAQEDVAEQDDDAMEVEDKVTPWKEIQSDMAEVAADLEDDYEEEEASAPEPPVAKARLRVQELSSSSESDSETESDEEDENDEAGGGGTSNMLEAALKAAASGSGGSSTTVGASSTSQRSQQRGAFSLDATGSAKDQPKLGRDASNPVHKKRPRTSDTDGSAIVAPDKKVTRAKHQLGSTTSSSSLRGSSNNHSTIKSTLLWPALDEFYDFILELSPRRIEVPDKHQANLRRYFRSTLPAKYASLTEYTSVQTEAIMEELAASLRSSEQFSSQNSVKSLFLTSVSPCGRASGQLPSGQQLNSSSIFMESGFSGSTSGKDDFILTFRRGGGSSSSSDFISGDLIMLRSPRWKQYEMIVYGVVLCNSVVAIGGSSSGGGGNGSGGGRGGDSDNDLVCVLIRTRECDHANPKEDFSVLTEMCLANQRSSNWKWRLEQVHNLTTSAREFQAIKSVAFFSPSIKRSLLEGKMSASDEQKSKSSDGDGKTSASGSNEAKSRLTPALHAELAKKYNASQLEAILGCIGEENHVIIQGPVCLRLVEVEMLNDWLVVI